MANKYDKSVDTTYLSLEFASERGFIHRDYVAHCLRWSYVVKYLYKGGKFKTAHVLDVGCGRLLPLAKMMYSMRLTHTSGSYTGVDYGPVKWPDSISKDTDKWRMHLFERTDFCKAQLPRKNYDLITSFEVLEHVEPYHSYSMLRRMAELVAKTGRVIISTPCYDSNVGAANNHVNEMTFAALEAIITAAGLEVEHCWGTFASQKDYKPELDKSAREVFDRLSTYYDSNVVACIFAPLVPMHSRNCLWQLKPGKVVSTKLSSLKNGKHCSSSTKWAADVKKILKEVSK